MKKIYYLLSVMLFTVSVNAADLIEVSPVTNKIILLKFDDGYIIQHTYHQSSSDDQSFLWPLDVERASNPEIYSISSSNDPNYANSLNPLRIGRKSKGHDFSKKCINWNEEPWAGAACKNDYASYHYIYLELPEPMVSGSDYTIKFSDLADNVEEYVLEYDITKTRAISIHSNHFGYSTNSAQKYAYISQWMGTLGPLTDEDIEGKRFDVYQLNENGTLQTSVFNGTVTKQHAYNEKDYDRTFESPYGNFQVSDVYDCDFSSLNTEGEYLLVVEGIGCSYPFKIREDAYQEAFYMTMKGLFLERALIGAEEEHAGKWAHPAWEDADFVYTSVRTMDLTDESGNNQKLNIFENFDWDVDLSGIRGWYHDAGDWDGYFSHFRIPRSLLWTYELAPDNFKDGELDIPESQSEYNGLSGTHIPDILDEAVFLVDYFKNNVGPTGGIFGSRIHPDISSIDESKGITEENYPDFTFRNCREEGIPSWEDCTTWIVHGEDPRDSYAFASIAAQYAYVLGIASGKTGEDYSDIIAEYLASARDAYNWALANTQSGDESVKYFIENRAAAAAWLYKMTGEQSFIDQLKSDLTNEGITSATTDPGENKWAVWAYATIDETNPLYTATFDAVLHSELIEVSLNYANERVLSSIDQGRSMRWGGGMSQPVWNGQGTTPWILPAMVAKEICRISGDSDEENYMNACFTTSDYFLGGNQLNKVWLTGAGHNHVEQILHHDSEYNPNQPGYIPGIPPYGPRPRCDWFAPASPHPYAGDYCYYNNSHDADFALLDGRIFPAYTDDNAELTWPIHELYFENYACPPTNEFTTHQTVAPAAAAYGFVTSSGGDLSPNEEPSISLSSSSTDYLQGEDMELIINASDPDGWIYRIYIYEDNHLVETLTENQNSINLNQATSGSKVYHAVVEDNMGLFIESDELEIQVNAADDLPEVNITSLTSDGLYRISEELEIIAEVSGTDIKVEFYNFNEKIGEDLDFPFSIKWTPEKTGSTEISAKVTDSRGFSDLNVKQINITENCLSLISPEPGEEFEMDSYVVVKALPESCSEAINSVTFYIGKYLYQQDITASPADGSYGVSFKNLSDGEYTVYAIAETENSLIISDSIHFSVIDPSLGISPEVFEELIIYPNPSESGFTFSYRLLEAADIRIQIYDINGKLMTSYNEKSTEIKSDSFFWDTSEFSPGIYSYSIIAGSQLKNGTLILN